MNSSPGAPFVYWMERPRRVRAIPLFFIGFIAACIVYLVVEAGVSDVAAGFHDFPALWLLVVMLAALVAFLLRYAFPPRGSQPRLEVGRDRIRFVPSLVLRRWFAEPIFEIEIPPNASEIVLCDRLLEEVPDGFWIVVRAADETEREIGLGRLALLDRARAEQLQKGIASVTGLPVRLAIRRRRPNGAVVESAWPAKPKHRRGYVAVGVGFVPYLGGFVVGYFLPRPAIIVAVGAALWAAEMAALYLYARLRQTPEEFPTLYSVATLFTFAASYAVAVVIVGFIFRAR